MPGEIELSTSATTAMRIVVAVTPTSVAVGFCGLVCVDAAVATPTLAVRRATTRASGRRCLIGCSPSLGRAAASREGARTARACRISGALPARPDACCPPVDVVDFDRHPAFPRRRIIKVRTVVRTLLYVKGGLGAVIAADAIVTRFWTNGS